MTDDDPVVANTIFRFNSVYVIESLADGELKTGTDLYDSVIFPGSRQLEGILTSFSSTRTRDDFARQLAQVSRAARLGNHHPIIHIEAHGGDHGIALADGTGFSWRELIPMFGDINRACRMNLIVVAISCYGWNLTGALMPSDRAPVAMVIGPTGPMMAGELLAAARRFYESLFAEIDLNKALQAMNDGRDYDSWLIKPGLAEILFCRVFRRYVEELDTPEARSARADRIVADVMKTGRPESERALLRHSILRDLADTRGQFDRFRERFLMLDLFPEDADRFGLTYERCLPSVAG